ncbi:assimilatory sulfite reductase (NADPH) hemoprotein subunit [Wenzhouxiangella sp. AB-CW3]|uniref:assimilatory sulfite reductase (NADPH) hemoprotein subunit n=1 Tax=Wenzhouxiangella sp. AB-CW3 TaxID=2771012 RepID=UPI00168AC0F0|nr:assimilatory sulfite reductase (NADPH) hemoprotein subunit [Wenzhouxiangella sp. AB-CW3]QOC22652.1 assimilatory sulfite reductase (NADPH) hemoprotein subunit [Wenzhouxiangella sp. AB-CW3]
MADLDVEKIKLESRGLRGTLHESLNDPLTGGIAESDTILTKFHGLYQQDDRDLRQERREARLEPLYQFMLRVRIPGGHITPEQWAAMDGLADSVANGTIRLTTRQAVQFHGVAKEDLRTLIRRLDDALLDSIAACGDVNRNVMCHVQPEAGPVHAQALAWARRLSEHLLPRSRAWREIWVDGEKVDIDRPPEEEPIYGRSFLPRKFKAAIAVPPVNDVDIYSQDLGFIAVAEDDRLVGFNVSVGGGLGCSHGEPETFPRLADVIGFIRPRDLLAVAEAVVTIQRDHGERENRKRARFKYTIESHGLDWFRRELEWRARVRLEPARELHFEHNGDRYGWIEQRDGRWQRTVFVENGRLLPAHRSGLREVISRHASDVRLTPNQNLVVAGVPANARDTVDLLLDSAGLGESGTSAVRRHAMACVAMPTCGLAMAEAERYLPDLLTRIEELAARHGIEGEPITVRMSGCPNGCSRPYLAEIGFVGRAPGRYNMYLGAAFDGSRLSRLYLDNADEAEILDTIDTLFERYAADREDGERFGDFLVRSGQVAAVEHGSEVNQEEVNREQAS